LKTLPTTLGKNAWFFLPFLLWVITGAVLQLCFFTHEGLFLAINHAHCEWADVLMTGLTYIGDGVTFGIMLAVLLILRKFRLFFNAATVLILVTIIIQTAKHVFNAPRPMHYFLDTSVVHTVRWVTTHGSNSFPSGHTTTAFAMFCLLALVSNNKKLGVVYITLALIVAWSRIYLAQHFFIDVYVGSIVGTLCSLFTFTLFEQKRPRPTTNAASASPDISPEAAIGLG
jgi:membrane-associated phospholipid phosphatase